MAIQNLSSMQRIQIGYKRLKRSNAIKNIFFSNPHYISAKEALRIYNELCIPLEILPILMASHDLKWDEKGFCELLEEQELEFKNSRQCNGNPEA